MHQNHKCTLNAANLGEMHRTIEHLLNLSPFSRKGLCVCVGKRWDGVVFKFSWLASLFWLKERLDVKALSHSESSQKCSCQWEERQATGMTPYVPDDFGKTLTATQEGKLFSLLFSQAAAWLKAKWVTLLDTPNQPTALIFHTDGSCVSKQHAAKDKRRRGVLEQGKDPLAVCLHFPDWTWLYRQKQ